MKTAIFCGLIILCGCSSPRKQCNLERIANAHREELSQMLSNYPATTMDLMHTISVLENETGHYQ